MAFVAAVIGGVAAVGGALIGAGASNANSRRANDTNENIAELDTRTSSIDQLISELESTAQQQQSTSLNEFTQQQQQQQSVGQEQATGLEQIQQMMQEASTGVESQTGTINNNSQQSTSGVQNTASNTSQNNATTGNVQGSATGTISRGNELNQAALDNLTAQLATTRPDVQAAIQSLMAQTMRDGQGQINDTVAQSGTFDSTTEALLRNDLNVKAAEAGAQLQLQQGNVQNEQLLQAILAGQQGTERSNQLTSEQQQMLEAIQANTSQSQQNDSVTGTTSTEQRDLQTANQQQSLQNVQGSTASSNNTNTQNNTTTNNNTVSNATENSAATSQGTQRQNNITINDTLTQVEEGIQPASGSSLANLVNAGSAGADVSLVNPVASSGNTPYLPAVGGGMALDGAFIRDIGTIGNIGSGGGNGIIPNGDLATTIGDINSLGKMRPPNPMPSQPVTNPGMQELMHQLIAGQDLGFLGK